MTWTELETSTYQHHVIQHVIGATVLGWFIAEDAVHFVLDIGLLWTIYVNAEMNLMALFVAIEDLESEGLSRQVIEELTADAQRLLDSGRDGTDLKHFNAVSVNFILEEVALFSADSLRRTFIAGETAMIDVCTSSDDSSVKVVESPRINTRIR